MKILHEPWPRAQHAVNRFTTLLSVFCQVFEWPTQRPVSISPSVVEAKSDKSRDVVLYLDGRWATQVLSGSSRVYESKTCKNLFCSVFGQIYEVCTNEKFPLYGVHLQMMILIQLIFQHCGSGLKSNNQVDTKNQFPFYPLKVTG